MNLSRRPPSVALCAIFCFAAAAEPPAGGAAAKPPSLDAQLTAAQTRVGELEALQTGWTAEKATLTGERDRFQARVTELEGQLTAATHTTTQLNGQIATLQGQLTTANGSITTLTRERDDAVTLAANPSAQARAILAAAGAPAVSMRPEGSKHPADAGKTAVDATNLAGKSPLQRAVARNIAAADAKKQR